MYMLCTKGDKIQFFPYDSYWAEILWLGIWHQVNMNNTIFWVVRPIGGENKMYLLCIKDSQKINFLPMVATGLKLCRWASGTK